MTGRELIIYILKNGLEDKPIFGEGAFFDFMSEEEFAARMEVGVATVRAWIEIGFLTAVRIGDAYYIPRKYSEWVKLLSASGQHNKGSEDND